MVGRLGRFLRSNIVGFVALFFALGGVAYALPGQNTVDSGDIIDNAVKSVDIRGGAVGPADLAPSVRPRWARVDADGIPAILRHRGATNVSDTGNGSVNVNFSMALNNCGWTATLNDLNSSGAPPPGEISVRPAGTNSLNVNYANSVGAAAEFPAGSGFTVVVHC